VRMGIRMMKPEDKFIEVGSTYLDQMKLKKEVLAKHYDEVMVFRATPSTELAKREVLDMVVDCIIKEYPNMFKMEGDNIHNLATDETWKVKGEKLEEDPLIIASLLVQEDFCILEQDDDGGDVILTGGCVCFPMRWSLRDKYAKELTIVHKPVQPFKAHLENPVRTALKNLRQPIWRANWALFDDLKDTLDLYTPTSSAERGGYQIKTSVDEAGDKLFYRSERQTLSRLPKSNAILFTIRTVQYPLKHLVLREDKTLALGLIKAMEVMDETFREYKSADRWMEAATGYINKNLNV